MREINKIVLHCSASPQTQTVKAILNYWKGLGWRTPGYHHLIEANGTVHNLVPIETPSNGVAGHNHDSIHISYIGGVTTKATHPVDAPGTPVDNRTAQQKERQKELVEKYSKMFPKAVILGHRDFSPDKNKDGRITPNEWIKACPSFEVKDWLKEIKLKSQLPIKYFKTTTVLNIREGAGSAFPTVTNALLKGIEVKRLAELPEWMYVEVKGTNILGWVATKYLTEV